MQFGEIKRKIDRNGNENSKHYIRKSRNVECLRQE